jgi:hypothetical protein
MGGAEHSVPAVLPGRLFSFRGSMTCGYGRALTAICRGIALLGIAHCAISDQPRAKTES